MGIIGSVQGNPTVSSITLTAETATFPEANLTVVAIDVGTAEYLSIPIDSSKNAIFPNSGGNPTNSTPYFRTLGNYRNVQFKVTGTALNYSVYSLGTSPLFTFYYGTPLSGAKTLANYAGVVALSTASSGSGTFTWTFPSGGLTMTGTCAGMGLAAASQTVDYQWATSSGKTVVVQAKASGLTNAQGDPDIVPVNVPISQTVAGTYGSATGSDKVLLYAFYQ